MTPDNLNDTIRNQAWVDSMRSRLVRLFPDTYTHFININIVSLGFNLKMIGVDYRTDQDLAECLAVLEREKILLRQDHCLKRGFMEKPNA